MGAGQRVFCLPGEEFSVSHLQRDLERQGTGLGIRPSCEL